MDFSLSLSPLREPVAIYLPVSNYSLVNTEKEAWKTELCIHRSRAAELSKLMLLPFFLTLDYFNWTVTHHGGQGSNICINEICCRCSAL